MSDATTQSEPLTERQRYEKVYADLGLCLQVTAAKSDFDRLTTVRDYLGETLFPLTPPDPPVADPPAGDDTFGARRRR